MLSDPPNPTVRKKTPGINQQDILRRKLSTLSSVRRQSNYNTILLSVEGMDMMCDKNAKFGEGNSAIFVVAYFTRFSYY